MIRVLNKIPNEREEEYTQKFIDINRSESGCLVKPMRVVLHEFQCNPTAIHRNVTAEVMAGVRVFRGWSPEKAGQHPIHNQQ